MVKRYAIYWVDLNPTNGSEIKKVRPAVVISPDELNEHLDTVTVVPITSKSRCYPWRVPCEVEGKKGFMVTDQIRSIDKLRLGAHIGNLSAAEIEKLKDILEELLIL